MAIGFARISLHTRSKRHSAAAGATYRAGVALEDERIGEVHNFTNRHDVAYQSILPLLMGKGVEVLSLSKITGVMNGEIFKMNTSKSKSCTISVKFDKII